MKFSQAKLIPFVSGLAMSINFILFWAIPIAGMGQIWKSGLKNVLLPIYDRMDQSTWLRSLAQNYVYTKPEHSDFFAISLLLLANAISSFVLVLYWHIKYGYLPFWLIALYYCSWVGVGGRMMGAGYALAHKEGHHHNLYKKWIRNSFGHIFENCLGCFSGSVPWNFTTSHVFIHHKLDGGIGDTFYEWDLDRTNLFDFLLYVHRVFLHMTGFSSCKIFFALGENNRAKQLFQGVVTYWAVAGIILLVTRSFRFLFFIYVEPLLCMTYFLALINIGFHGFIEYDSDGVSIPCVNSSTIINGDDDYFGEDDHMAHHYNSGVYYRDLPVLQKSKVEEFKKYKASVFQKLSVVELSIFIVFQLWDKLAEHYVDYSGAMTKQEIMDMLKARATRIEVSYERYEKYLTNPSLEARKELKKEILSSVSGKTKSE